MSHKSQLNQTAPTAAETRKGSTENKQTQSVENLLMLSPGHNDFFKANNTKKPIRIVKRRAWILSKPPKLSKFIDIENFPIFSY